MSRKRTDDLIDTVLRKLPQAPPGTFQHRSGQRDPFPSGNRWVEGQVLEYISQHTVDSIAEDVTPREMKDYDFPEDLGDVTLAIKTGVGYFYNPLRGKSYAGKVQSSKTLNGEHDCWDPSSRFSFPIFVIRSEYDTKTGSLTLEASNAVDICGDSHGNVGPILMASFQEYMSEWVNRDDPKIAQDLRRAQKLERGWLPTDFKWNSAKHATEWLKAEGLTCSDMTPSSVRPTKVRLQSKHIDEGVTENTLLAGTEMALDDFETKSQLSPEAKAVVRTAITQVLGTLLPQRPERSTLAHWSQSLTDTAVHLGQELSKEGSSAQRQSRTGWSCDVTAEIVEDPPQDESRLRAPQSYYNCFDPTGTAGYIKACGRTSHSRLGSTLLGKKTNSSFSLWIPIQCERP